MSLYIESNYTIEMTAAADAAAAATERNNSMITLDVRISCDTFWKYKFDIPIRIRDFYNANESRIRNNNNINSNTCEIGNIGRRDPRFLKLESYLVDYAIQFIYDDIIQNHQEQYIPILLKKVRKFHIHGRTIEDLLFPANNHMTENIVYICTHC
jgi:hypothetical protein